MLWSVRDNENIQNTMNKEAIDSMKQGDVVIHFYQNKLMAYSIITDYSSRTSAPYNHTYPGEIGVSIKLKYINVGPLKMPKNLLNSLCPTNSIYIREIIDDDFINLFNSIIFDNKKI